MKKILLCMLVAILCFSCEKEEKYVVATVTTTVTDITSNSAVIRGTVNIEKQGKNADDINIAGKGFYYRKQGNEWKKFELSQDENFNADYTGLAFQTAYEVQTYVKIGNNEVRGNTVTFTTKSATTAQVRFKKTAVSYCTIITVDLADGGRELARYEFGTGTGTSPYYEIPAGNHVIWFYDYYSDDWICDSELKTFQAGRKYTITIDENSYSNLTYHFNDDGTFSSTALRSKIPTTITVSKERLKVQKEKFKAIALP